MAAAGSITPPLPRTYAGVNWLGFYTLYLKEVRRFSKIPMQTVLAPLMMSLLYMLVFGVASKGARPPVNGIRYTEFIAPGLVMMNVLNNAFANSSSSILQAKMMGLSADFLTPPLSSIEQSLAFILGSATRGIVVGLVTLATVWWFAGSHLAHPWAAVWFMLTASLIMGELGVLAGLWAEKFDQMAMVQTFVIMPLSFLSGTFYTIERMPEPFRTASYFNPFFYLTDGFRYGFLGISDANLLVGVVSSGLVAAGMGVWCWWLFWKGFRLKT
jgi:ABC-2 type transport system permease protein